MIELLRNRRSVRVYQARPIEKEKLELLREALLRSPSSRNFDPWEFIFVTGPDKLKRLSQAKQHGAAFLSGAPLGIVVCANETESDVWIEDCSIASILVQMAAQSLGLGSCWIQIRNRLHKEGLTSDDYVRQVLAIPDHIRVESIIAVGCPAEQKSPIPKEELKFDKIHEEKW